MPRNGTFDASGAYSIAGQRRDTPPADTAPRGSHPARVRKVIRARLRYASPHRSRGALTAPLADIHRSVDRLVAAGARRLER